MKKLFFLLMCVLLNNQSINSQEPPCGVLNQVPSSPTTTALEPNDIALSPVTSSGEIIVAVTNPGSNNVLTYPMNTTTGALGSVGSPLATTSGLSTEFSPITSSGALFAAVANTLGNAIDIYSVSPTGTFMLVSTTSVTVPIWAIYSSLTSTNQLFLVAAVADTQTTGHLIVYSVDTTSGALTQVASSPIGAETATIIQPAISPFIAPNTFYIAACNENGTEINVYNFNTSTNALTAVTGSPFPAGTTCLSVAFSPLVGGNLFAGTANAGSNNASVFSVNTSNGVFTQLSSSPFPAGINPSSITFSPAVGSNLYAAVSNASNNTINVYSVNTSTGVFTPVGSGSGSFPTPGSPSTVKFSPLIGGNKLFVGVANSAGATTNGNAAIYSVDLGPTANANAFDACTGVAFSGTVTATPSGLATITGFNVVTSTTHGSLVGPNASGNFTYTPNSGYTGPDSFVFTATDSNGCTSNTATASFTVLALPTVSIAPAIQVVCPNESINFSANAIGTGPFTYSWTGPNGFTENTGATPSLTIAGPTVANTGNYAVTVTGTGGCQGTSPVAEVVVKASVC